jgi:hypothetical protein
MATRTCTAGACDGTCAAGFGDCNGNRQADGCETDLTDVSHCGACGNSCDDGDPCTVDSCSPRATCSNLDASACGTPACASSCGFSDTDGDSLNDTWETNGYIDLDCNGTNDPGVDTPLPNADVNVPNIYLKYDYMERTGSGAACTGPLDCPAGEQCVGNVCVGHSHAPSAQALDLVTQAFAAHQIILTFDALPDAIEERAVITFDPVDPTCTGPDAVSFYELKPTHFPAPLAPAYHYAIFAHLNTCDSPASCASCPPSPGTGATPTFGTPGIAERPGNDLMVTFGFWVDSALPVTDEMVAGTFMHQLGHNLNLLHGGSDDLIQKPNYFSVMNPSYQFGIGVSALPGPYPTSPVDPSESRRIDYSAQALAPLDECGVDGVSGGLDELLGVSGDPGGRDVVVFYTDAGATKLFAPSNRTPVDWNNNGSSVDMHVVADISGDGQCSVLNSFNDWATLLYAFQCTPQFPDGPPLAAAIASE